MASDAGMKNHKSLWVFQRRAKISKFVLSVIHGQGGPATLHRMAPSGDPVEIMTAPIPAQSPFIPATRRSWCGRSLRRRLIRSRWCCYRVSSTGCASGGTRTPTRSTGGSSGEGRPASRRRVGQPERRAGTLTGSCRTLRRTAHRGRVLSSIVGPYGERSSAECPDGGCRGNGACSVGGTRPVVSWNALPAEMSGA